MKLINIIFLDVNKLVFSTLFFLNQYLIKEILGCEKNYGSTDGFCFIWDRDQFSCIYIETQHMSQKFWYSLTQHSLTTAKTKQKLFLCLYKTFFK